MEIATTPFGRPHALGGIPFGECPPPPETTPPASSPPSTESMGEGTLLTSPAPTRYIFTGKELDSTGLYYFAARYYDPSLGRFITEDPYWNASGMSQGVQGNESIAAILQSTNLYVYCGNNPLILVDPSGKVFMLATGLVGAVAGGIGGALYSLRVNQGRGVHWRHVATGAAIVGAIGLTGGAAASLVVTAGKTPLATFGAAIPAAAVTPSPYLQKVSGAAHTAACILRFERATIPVRCEPLSR